jgi:hypothetical protein
MLRELIAKKKANAVDCGVFVCANAMVVRRGQDPAAALAESSAKLMDKYRKHIEVMLVKAGDTSISGWRDGSGRGGCGWKDWTVRSRRRTWTRNKTTHYQQDGKV